MLFDYKLVTDVDICENCVFLFTNNWNEVEVVSHRNIWLFKIFSLEFIFFKHIYLNCNVYIKSFVFKIHSNITKIFSVNSLNGILRFDHFYAIGSNFFVHIIFYFIAAVLSTPNSSYFFFKSILIIIVETKCCYIFVFSSNYNLREIAEEKTRKK